MRAARPFQRAAGGSIRSLRWGRSSRVIAAKQRMTVAAPGGTREVDVPRFLRTQACLSAAQVVELAQLALTLEAALGRPGSEPAPARCPSLPGRPMATATGLEPGPAASHRTLSDENAAKGRHFHQR